MKTTLQVLIDARELISSPFNWTKLSSARDRDGRATEPEDPRVCTYCAAGAVIKAAEKNYYETSAALQALSASIPSKPFHGVLQNLTSYNDSAETTHKDILKLFDQAIEANSKIRIRK